MFKENLTSVSILLGVSLSESRAMIVMPRSFCLKRIVLCFVWWQDETEILLIQFNKNICHKENQSFYIFLTIMNKTTTFLGVAAIAAIAGIALSSGLQTSASEVDAGATATQSQPTKQWFGFGRGWKHHEQFEAVKTAIENKDFAAFQAAIKETPLAETITTQEQFDKFIQMHTLREEWKTEEAQAIADELGLPEMKGKGMRGDPAKMEAVKTAITANDFTAFQTAIAADANSPLASIDTAEEFAKLVKMHSLLDEAKAIGDELGLPGPHGWGKMGKWEKWFGKWMK